MKTPSDSWLLATDRRELRYTRVDGRVRAVALDCGRTFGVGFGATQEEAAAHCMNDVMTKAHAEEESR